MAKRVTKSDVRALLAEAATAGDKAQVTLCELALAGDPVAMRECVRVILEARAQQSG